MKLKKLLMSSSSVRWSGSVVCLGGMYRFVISRCLCCVRWIFEVGISVLCMFRCCGV